MRHLASVSFHYKYMLNYALIDNVGDDCPVFDGLFDYCAISAGGSMGMCALSSTASPY